MYCSVTRFHTWPALAVSIAELHDGPQERQLLRRGRARWLRACDSDDEDAHLDRKQTTMIFMVRWRLVGSNTSLTTALYTRTEGDPRW